MISFPQLTLTGAWDDNSIKAVAKPEENVRVYDLCDAALALIVTKREIEGFEPTLEQVQEAAEELLGRYDEGISELDDQWEHEAYRAAEGIFFTIG